MRTCMINDASVGDLRPTTRPNAMYIRNIRVSEVKIELIDG